MTPNHPPHDDTESTSQSAPSPDEGASSPVSPSVDPAAETRREADGIAGAPERLTPVTAKAPMGIGSTVALDVDEFPLEQSVFPVATGPAPAPAAAPRATTGAIAASDIPAPDFTASPSGDIAAPASREPWPAPTVSIAPPPLFEEQPDRASPVDGAEANAPEPDRPAGAAAPLSAEAQAAVAAAAAPAISIPAAIRWARFYSYARWVVLLPLVYFLWMFLQVAVPRFTYPYEIEWFEGNVAVHADRVAQGLPQYPNPYTSGWATFSYPPVYFYVVGFLYNVFGFSLGLARFVSLLATLAAAAGAYAIVWDHTRKRLAAAIGALMLFAYYKPSGYWFDLARVDMLAQALVAWGVFFAFRKRPTHLQTFIGCVLLGLAGLAKQTVGFISLAAYVIILLRYWKYWRWFFVVGIFALINVAYVYMYTPSGTVNGVAQKNTGGGRGSLLDTPTPNDPDLKWFVHYIALFPGKKMYYWNRVHPEGIEHAQLPAQLLASPTAFVKSYIVKFKARPPEVWEAFYRHIALPVLAGAVWLALSLVRLRKPRGGVWFLFFPLILYGSLVAWTMIGGFANNFIPGLCAAAVFLGLAVGGIEGLLPRRWMRVTFDGVVLAGLLLQLFGERSLTVPFTSLRERLADRGKDVSVATAVKNSLWWTKDRGIAVGGLNYVVGEQRLAPTSKARGDELLAWLKENKGQVYIPHHIYLMRLSGAAVDYNIDAVRDLEYSGIPTMPLLVNKLNQGTYRYVLLNMPVGQEWLPGPVKTAIETKYRQVPVGDLPAALRFKDGREFMPLTGAVMRPQTLYILKDAPTNPGSAGTGGTGAAGAAVSLPPGAAALGQRPGNRPGGAAATPTPKK